MRELEVIKEEERLSVSRLCEMIWLSRPTYYRRKGKKNDKRRGPSRPVREVIGQQARELAEEQPSYGG